MNEENKENDEFDYFKLWDKQEKKEQIKLEKELPKGRPRKGIKGKYIKAKGYVSKRRIKSSYKTYLKGLNNQE